MIFSLQYFGIIWLTVLQLSRPYVLFAANMDDFRRIAKQFVPDHLAEQIAKIAAEIDVTYLKSSKHDKKYEEDIQTHANNKYKKKFSVKDTINLDRYTIDIDEIVEKVKEKLKKDFNLREELQKRDSYDQDETKDGKYVNKNEKHSKFPTKDVYHDTSRQEADLSNEYGEINTESTTKVLQMDEITENDQVYQTFKNNDGIYKTVSLIKRNDSYEEYVISKEDDTTQQIKQRMKIIIGKSKIVNKIALKTPKEPVRTDYELSEKLLKAKTDSLLYEDETTDTTINTETTKANVFKKPKKSRSGTIKPKMDFYKMSAPNYYAKLPNVAESYKFDEPIPVDDQEPENLKPIRNPPASIYKKVKLI